MLRLLLIELLLLLSFSTVEAQSDNDVKSSYLSSHYSKRLAQFESEDLQKCDFLFLGNSITERGKWQELIGDNWLIANRGIGGDNTFGVLARLTNTLALSPKKIFLMIGINDIGQGARTEGIIINIDKIIKLTYESLPHVEVYIQSILPVNHTMTAYTKGRHLDIIHINNTLKHRYSERKNIKFLDLYSLFSDESGSLATQFTTDGVHLNESAYDVWVDFLRTNGCFDK